MNHCIQDLLQNAMERLSESGSESPQLDAAVLLCHALDKPRSYLLTWPEKIPEPEQIDLFEKVLARRLQGEPVAYILGEREFWSLSLKVSPSTLIPRPDTERLVELALDKLSVVSGDVLDLGTGTGAIALAIASECPTLNVMGVDIREEAKALATENAARLQIANAHFQAGSWFEPIADDHKFAVIVSNPPYIDETDPHLSQGDVRFEPASALVAPNKGLADLDYISEHAREFLQAGGWLLMEHGFEQGPAVRDILIKLGYDQVSTAQDYAGNDRVTLGCWT
ncbi:peptide chain release factor N(5)-glutamine methyltransferase [Vibrio sp. Of7-15]|uniref:peptide chain release factor N(5)-glutamine methyltransferase n=1 Tax=Vibrio sp. Of7-15 TaxID=2724879 RepID=UPI001EF1BCCC|nr:peptide chain release factor N(5)-glutamine methyltransferase [Vibrio sp. Of7-15]MCG7495732.1 peptide chain release factor N(5)-glutamine methyltransferase [Vibrio sp. Of7-15]